MGDLFPAANVHVVFQVSELHATSHWITCGTANKMVVRFAFPPGDTIQRLANIGGKAFTLEVLERPFCVLHNIVKNGDDFFHFVLDARHHPKRMQDIGRTEPVLLIPMRFYGNGDCLFQQSRKLSELFAQRHKVG